MSKPNNNPKPTQPESSPSELEKKEETKPETTTSPAEDGENKEAIEDVAKPEAGSEKKVLLVGGGWELAFRIADLIDGDKINVELIENQILTHKYHKTIPEALVDASVPHGAIVNYVRQILADKIDPTTVWFVVADPAVDETLKSINLMRRMISQPPTFFYPSFDADKHLPAEGN